MSDYKKKKQLIDENKDMYISEYDKNLSYEALSQIVDAKKQYANAAKNNDKKQMTLANNAANAVRAKYGSYTGGEFGDEYHPFSYTKTGFDDYNSKYEKEMDRLYDSYTAPREKFSYDYETDPVYLAYKSVYDKKGALAYDRALAQNSLKTGGLENTNAKSAAMQALGYYNSQLAAMIPELYNAAYERYYKQGQDELNRIKDSYGLIKERENRDYGRHLDRLSHERDTRKYLSDITEKEKDRIFDRMSIDAEYELQDKKLEQEQLNNSQEMLYKLIRDNAEDQKWLDNYRLSAYKSNYPYYSGAFGTTEVPSYIREIIDKYQITTEDLYRLISLPIIN